MNEEGAAPSPPSHSGWSEGVSLLRARVDSIPGLLRDMAQGGPLGLGFDSDFDPGCIRQWVTTGIGSSGAQARLLAHLLADRVGIPARFASTGSLAKAPPQGAKADGLIVFSQGLSPNARFALGEPASWQRVVLVTAVRPDSTLPESAAGFAARCAEQGVSIVLLPAAACDEYQTLLRVIGPALGVATAISLARALARSIGTDACIPDVGEARLCDGIESAVARVETLFPRDQSVSSLFARETVLLAAGGGGELLQNLRGKILEGMGLLQPPLWDLLEFAHGGYQRIADREATLIVLSGGADAASIEAPLVEGLRGVLRAELHDLRILPAALPSPWWVFEHEAVFNELVLRSLAERERDPRRWPGRGLDAPLYQLASVGRRGGREGSEEPAEGLTPERVARGAPRWSALEGRTWPEVERALAAGRRTAVVPLGSTEQHGPHLPLATDSWIAEALAGRFCQLVPEALRVPALTLGCASEHLGFAGTLSLSGESLERVLADLLASLSGHGFACAFVFSAHGGNLAVLRSMETRLRRGCDPLRLIAYTELDALVARWHEASAHFGVSPEQAGHHAGEFETSIVAALRPTAIRWSQLEAARGHVAPVEDAQSLFYPSLRDNAPNGVVGDPRGAQAARGERYLEVWVQALVERYRADATAR